MSKRKQTFVLEKMNKKTDFEFYLLVLLSVEWNWLVKSLLNLHLHWKIVIKSNCITTRNAINV